MHTREGHRPDLTDLPPAKKVRGRSKTCIGDAGPMGRILVRGEAGHDIIPELYPLPTEPVIDKPGKGAFFATDLHAILQNRGIKQLVVTGVTTEVCVNTTVREANDRGYDCLVPEDCVGSYFPEFQEMGLKMIKAQGGIFGWVSNSSQILRRCFDRETRLDRTRPDDRNSIERGILHGIRLERRHNAKPHASHCGISTRKSGCPATGTHSSGSAPTSWSICSPSAACCVSC